MAAAFSELLCVKHKQPARAILFAKLVPQSGGSKRLRVFLGHRPGLGELPVPSIGPGVAQVAS
jgi:hypothetical protein